jgi:thiol-disulfide isomerase/thioredoxin
MLLGQHADSGLPLGGRWLLCLLQQWIRKGTGMAATSFSGIARMVFALMVLLVIGCGGADAPTLNPVMSMDVDRFDQILSDPEFSGLVVVFASWCSPCRRELPHIARLYREQRPEGVQIVGLSLDEGDSRDVQRLVDELRIPFPVYHVGLQTVARYRTPGVPTVLVVERGRILDRLPGPRPAAELAARLKQLDRPAS